MGFARSAAAGTIAGLSAFCTFCIVNSACASRMNWLGSLLTASVSMVAVSLALSWLDLNLWLATAIALGSVVLAHLFIPSPVGKKSKIPARPWDLPARAAAATSLVLLLTGAARALGPQFTGLLSPFPLITGILGAFTHAQEGSSSLRALLRGVIAGTPSFIAFFVCIGLGLPRLDVAPCYLLALTATAATQVLGLYSWARTDW